MKIGVDFRFIKKDLYSVFIEQLIKTYILNKADIEFIIYTNSEIKDLNYIKNVVGKKINIENGSFKEQTQFCSILKKDKNDLVLFFNHFKPLFYKGEYIVFIGTLKDVYYSNFKNNIEKYKYLFLLEKNLKKAETVVCLDNNTKLELIERFNIRENKIKQIRGFFPKMENSINSNDINLDINSKYNLKNNFLIYSGGNGIEKNYEKLALLIKRLNNSNNKVDLIFLGESISKNINLRNTIISYKLQESIQFLGRISEQEKEMLYKKSAGVIFPSFYEPFPFRLTDPIKYNAKIISSDLKNIKNIFGDTIKYFSPISVNSIYNETIDFIKDKETKNYKEILENYNLVNSTKDLIKIIK